MIKIKKPLTKEWLFLLMSVDLLITLLNNLAKMKLKLIIPVLFLSIIVSSCKKDKPLENLPVKTGKISFQFLHKVNNSPLIFDTLIYTNAAGNQYLVNNIQYFVSEITLHNSSGSDYLINQGNGIHYIDTDIAGTESWVVTDDVPVGYYTSVSFIFGINEAKNTTGLFTNPPEVDMFWPAFLGGGYHYMKMNGQWKDTNNMLTPFNFHLGIGQIYAHNVIVVDSITGFIQNYFTVNLPSSEVTINEGDTTNTEITMNIESWFETPHVYDLNLWGGSIMQNQAAMQTIVDNGADVFTFRVD
jgi:hypothetical protein